MKFSYLWLREMVDGLAASPQELRDWITRKTAECEGVEEAAGDHVIEVDNKSLTHRPDLWGHYGLAREVAAILGHRLIDPVRPLTPPPQAAPVHVAIEDYSLCPRYSALFFENVTVQSSPAWMRKRLEAVGLNPVNNLVDVTNYVMAEIAQPMHAFDADRLAGNQITVRSARRGEIIAALNGESYTLDPSSLVIADASGAVALAGVIGGAPSAITGRTSRMVLESANFNASSIRKTSARVKLRTDASIRFEKAQDPVNTVRGLERACALLQEVSPGIRLAGGLADAYRPLPQRAPIELPLDWLERKLGRDVPAAEVRRILESLGFAVEQPRPGLLRVRVPSWRATRDVSIQDDLVEEVGRMVGYDTIAPLAPLAPARPPSVSPAREFLHRVRLMAAAQGFTEVHNYSFVSDEMALVFGLNPAHHVQVTNPIAADQGLLRASLLPGIWKNVNDNARHLESFRLFECGREIHRERESPHLAAAIYARSSGQENLLELKRLAECLLPGVEASGAKALPIEHPSRSAEIRYQGAAVGRLFEFHPRLVEAGRAAVLDLDLELVEQFVAERERPGALRSRPLRRFPASAFDLSVVAGARAAAAGVRDALAKLAGADLLEIAFLREFSLPGGSRSLSFRLTVGAPDRTLAAAEVGQIRARVVDGMKAAGYQFRE